MKRYKEKEGCGSTRPPSREEIEMDPSLERHPTTRRTHT